MSQNVNKLPNIWCSLTALVVTCRVARSFQCMWCIYIWNVYQFNLNTHQNKCQTQGGKPPHLATLVVTFYFFVYIQWTREADKKFLIWHHLTQNNRSGLYKMICTFSKFVTNSSFFWGIFCKHTSTESLNFTVWISASWLVGFVLLIPMVLSLTMIFVSCFFFFSFFIIIKVVKV